MVSNGFPNVTTSGQHYNIGEKPSVILLGVLIAKKTYRIFSLNVSRIFQMENRLSQRNSENRSPLEPVPILQTKKKNIS